MAEQWTLKQKIFKSLYGMGLKKFGADLLGDLRRGGPEWITFAQELQAGNDYPTRKIVVGQLVRRGFIEKSRNKGQLLSLLMGFLSSKASIGDEKVVILKFVSSNLNLFPTEDDMFRNVIMGLQHERNPQLSQLATDLLPKIGINMDDREMYRRH